MYLRLNHSQVNPLQFILIILMKLKMWLAQQIKKLRQKTISIVNPILSPPPPPFFHSFYSTLSSFLLFYPVPFSSVLLDRSLHFTISQCPSLNCYSLIYPLPTLVFSSLLFSSHPYHSEISSYLSIRLFYAVNELSPTLLISYLLADFGMLEKGTKLNQQGRSRRVRRAIGCHRSVLYYCRTLYLPLFHFHFINFCCYLVFILEMG